MPDGEIQAFIARDELSRIKVLNDRIKSVRNNDGEVEVVEDVNLGEIYIRPNGNNPLNMFVTTERNNTYKLLLLPKKAPSEQIFIKSLEEILNSDGSEAGSNGNKIKDSFKEHIIALLRAMSEEKEIAGFKKVKTQKIVELSGQELKATLIYAGAHLKGQVFEVENNFQLEEYGMEGIVASSISEEISTGKTKLYLVSVIDKGGENERI